MQRMLASFCKIDHFLNTPRSLRQANVDRRRNRFPQAALLKALEPIDRAVKGSLGRSVSAEESIQSFCWWYGRPV
jgi:hypothetical protein